VCVCVCVYMPHPGHGGCAQARRCAATGDHDGCMATDYMELHPAEREWQRAPCVMHAVCGRPTGRAITLGACMCVCARGPDRQRRVNTSAASRYGMLRARRHRGECNDETRPCARTHAARFPSAVLLARRTPTTCSLTRARQAWTGKPQR
jgi:hypothetical protein